MECFRFGWRNEDLKSAVHITSLLYLPVAAGLGGVVLSGPLLSVGVIWFKGAALRAYGERPDPYHPCISKCVCVNVCICVSVNLCICECM